MPTISIRGINVDLPPDAVVVAQRWAAPLDTVAQGLLDSATNFDPRVQSALGATQLAPLFRGLINVLVEVTALITPATGTSTDATGPLQSAVQDTITRYIEGFLRALDRLVRDWDRLGPIFFTQGADADAIHYQLASLGGVDPLPGPLAQGGAPSLVLHLTIGNLDTSPVSQLNADLDYIPHDVETECTVVGNTARLCSLGPGYTHCAGPCNHTWCRSVAERVNATLGDAAAIPTLIIWPAAAASEDNVAPADAYGYREHLPAGRPEDTTVPSPQAPDVAAFYRILGRELALACAVGAQDVEAGDFVVSRLRPYWVETGSSFALPVEDLGDTGMFDPPDGPLAPPPRTPGNTPPASQFGLVVTPPGSRTPPVPVRAGPSVADVRRGCAETLEALATLGPELGDRFQNGRNILNFFRPRGDAETRARQNRWLELLSLTTSWGDWQALDRETAQWQRTDDEAWSRMWFGGLLARLQTTVPAWSQLPAEAVEAIAPLRDEVTGMLRVSSFQEIQLPGVLALSPAERERLWQVLVALGNILGGYFRGIDWRPDLDESWDPLPTSVLVEFEAADHARARWPYFIRHLQLASLWAANGDEVKLADFSNAPPPRLSRLTFFPEPMSNALARRLALLANPGVRARLVSSIPRLMDGTPPPRSGPRPVGPPLMPTPPS